MTVLAQTIHLAINQGTTFIREYETTLDLRNFEAEAKFSRDYSEESIKYPFRVRVLDGDSNRHTVIELRLQPEDTASLRFGRYVYSVRAVAEDSNGDAYIIPMFEGIMDLIPGAF